MKIPWKRKWQPTPVLLSGESHGQRILVGYSPWSHKELDMTECLHFLFLFKRIYKPGVLVHLVQYSWNSLNLIHFKFDYLLHLLLGYQCMIYRREVMEFQLSYFKSWKMMLWKQRYTQYASKFGKLSSSHRTRKGQFSFQSQIKAMAKNAQTTPQLYPSHMLVK